MTANRREMLGQAAGATLAFIGCGLSPAFAQPVQRRREVVVNGKRVRTVDVHAHCHVPEANALMGLKVQTSSLVISPEAEAYFAKKGCKVLLQPTPEAIGAFNRSHAKKIGLFHVTC